MEDNQLTSEVFAWRDVYLDCEEFFTEPYTMLYQKGERVAFHTPFCVKQSALTSFAQYAWKQLFPNYCPWCSSHGTLIYDDQLCLNCITKGSCPRCGEQIIWSDELLSQFVEKELACPVCNWQWGKNENDYLPEHECYCWEGRLVWSG